MARMNHELRNRQQRARDSQRIAFEDERNQQLIDNAFWKESRRFSANNKQKRPAVSRGTPPIVRSQSAAAKMLFHGTLKDLKRMLRAVKVEGTWTSAPHRVWTLRCSDGALLNWAEGSGKLWLQGPPEAAGKLEAQVRKGFEKWLRR
nr:hypothetical protein [Nitrosomonas nitrosa]